MTFEENIRRKMCDTKDPALIDLAGKLTDSQIMLLKQHFDPAKRRHKLPEGECNYCDRERKTGTYFHPSHDPSSQCQSGKRPHCTCDTCF